ncbi:MAG: FG-GAP-like repeat-containing protein [Bacteroidales bacterium]|jgi:RHS repeat-associated protein|nr:FG-GAP-like repeat-containing protein [Bacteroidales bacterium]
MRKIYIILIIITMSVFSFDSLYCQSEGSCNILECTGIYNGESFLESKERVVLKTGFSYKAENNSYLKAYVNSNRSCDIIPSYNDENYYTHSTTFSVGAIPGVAGVSPTGASTYEIPVFVSPGVNGIEPQISIQYNSQAGNSLLGKGWSLQGLSKIELDPNVYYLDGFNESVKNSGSTGNRYQERFALDGNRLVLISGNFAANGSEYRTINETFKQIKYYKTGNDSYFEVKDKNGMIYYYGKTGNSRIGSAGTKILSWYLNKVEDPNGNYIEYEYENYSDVYEKAVKKIRYTGNGDQLPSNEIEFFYINRSDFFQKKMCSQTLYNKRILVKITVKSSNSLVKSYEFRYSKDPDTKLSEIVEKSGDDKRLNSTVIEWGQKDESCFTKPHNDMVTAFSVHSGGFFYDGNENYNDDFDMSNFSSAKITPLTGDFNGDGITDFAVYYRNCPNSYDDCLYTSGWLKAYTGKKGGGFTPSDRIHIANNNANEKRFTVGDIDYDGKDEFIEYNSKDINGYNDGNYNYYRKLSQQNTFGSRQQITDSSSGPIKPSFGNFYGNGKVSFLKFYDNNSNHRYWSIDYYSDNDDYHYYIYRQKKSFMSQYVTFSNQIYQNGFTQPIDFDGDGHTDVFGIVGSNIDVSEIVLNNNNFSAVSMFNVGTIIDPQDYQLNYEKYKFGDFNGDGKTDLLKYQEENKWRIYYSDGTEFNTSYYDAISLESGTVGCYKQVYAIDMNGDGICDIVEQIDQKFNIWITIGNGNFHKLEHIIPSSVAMQPLKFFGDFNGDGKMDLIYYDDNTKSLRILYFMLNDKSDMVVKITDGLLYVNEFDYIPQIWKMDLYNDAVTNITYKSSRKFTSPLKVVSSHKNSTGLNGSASMKNTKYNFLGGWSHVQGKGFIGFKLIETDNEVDNNFRKIINVIDYTNYLISEVTKTDYLYRSTGNPVVREYTKYLVRKIDTNIPGYIAVLPEKTENIDYLLHNNNSTKTTITYQNQLTGVFLGNINSITTDYSGVYTETTNYQDYSSAGSWCLSRPQIVITHKTRDNETKGIKNTYTYDSKGQVATSVRESSPVAGEKPLTTTFTYDNFGNELTVAQTGKYNITGETQTRTITYQYEPTGRFVNKITDAAGLVTEYQYDSKFGNKIWEKDPLENIINYEYDGFGNLTKVITPFGNTTVDISWADVVNLKLAYYENITTDGKPDIQTWYDILGRNVKTRTNLYNKNSFMFKTYNQDGTLMEESLPYFGTGTINWKTYGYDFYKRPVVVTELDLETSVSRAATSITTRYPDGISEVKFINPAGESKQIISTNGEIVYTYNAFGTSKSISAEGSVTTMNYDEYGNQTVLTDPNAGTTSYVYNAFGELIKQSDANGNEFTMVYNPAGQIVEKLCNNNQFSTTYTYYTSGNYKGLLQKEQMGNGNSREYEYDQYGNISKMHEKIDGTVYTHEYTYDDYNNPETYTYPSGFRITNEYNSYGFLTKVYKGNTRIWEYKNVNEMGQVTEYTLFGTSTIDAKYTFNDYFELENIKISKKINTKIFDYDYSFDHNTGNLMNRRDLSQSQGLFEEFTYDTKNRLTCWTRFADGFVGIGTAGYANNGNINNKAGVGAYTYDDDRLHAVTEIESQGISMINTSAQDISYNPFLKTESVYESLEFSDIYYSIVYGPDQQRKKTQFYDNGNLQRTRIYSGLYEKETIGSQIREYHYIPTGSGNVAVNIKYNEDNDTTYFLIRDHLGSIMKIVRPNGSIAEEHSYDPWGNHRNTLFGGDLDFSTTLGITRGFTGHEMLPEFQLINMNGRMYDPVISRVLSPDNFVQDPNNAQNYNRYSYCLNNPLKYWDPSGWLYDWYLNLKEGIVEHIEGNDDLFDKGYVHLAGDDANIQDIANSLTVQGFQWIYDTNTEINIGESRFRVDTEKQYKGWAMMMQTDAMLTIIGIGSLPPNLPKTKVGTSGLYNAGKGLASAKGSSNVLLNTPKQLQAKFKHAGDFGVLGNYSKVNATKFSSAINKHINSTGVQTINGTYRGQSVIHYLNPNTGLNVISSPSGQFISGWKLNPTQLQNILKHGGL